MGTQEKHRFRRVAVLKGGPSLERDVSLRSGAAVAGALRAAGYEAIEVDVTGETILLPPGVEAVFIALHGRFGEDGGVQGILDREGIPYTGSGAAASRAAMDKAVSRTRLREAGVPVPEGRLLKTMQASCPLPLPAVVKPRSQGSSIGCHIVREPSAWPDALADALRFDGAAIAERYIPGRELTVGILGGQELPVIEIRPAGGYYDYRAKYTAGMTEYQVPAALDPAVTREVQRLARAAFEAFGARGFGRVDFRLDDQGRLFALELNTIPGFTETSLVPKAAAAAGIAFSDLCDRILQLAAFG